MWSWLGGAGAPMLPAARRRLVYAGGAAAAAAGTGATLRARRAHERPIQSAARRGGASGAHAGPTRRPAVAASVLEAAQLQRREPGPLVQMLAGALAGGVARVFVAPLDVVKIRMQVQLEPTRSGLGKYTGLRQACSLIAKEEGLRGLWRGTAPALLLWVPYTAIQFAALARFNTACEAAGVEPHRPPASFAGGASAAAVATLCTYPLDLLRTVMAAQGVPPVYPSVAAAARGTVRQRGVGGLFAGLSFTLLEIIPYAALQFGSYEALKSALLARRTADASAADSAVAAPPALGALDKFFAGVAAGSAAKLALHPLDVAKKRLQVAGLARSAAYGAPVQVGAYRGIVAALAALVRAEGVAGLYKGLLPNVLKAAPASGITFVVYEGIVTLAASMQQLAAAADAQR